VNKVQIVPAPEKFDVLASTYDDVPAGYYEQWDGTDLMNLLGDVSGRSILDVGCGTGRLMKRLEVLGADTLGIDISKRMVEKAEGKRLWVLQADINSFVWNEEFDIILSILTLNYIQDKTTAFKNIYFLLKRQGRVVISSDLQQEDIAVRKGQSLIAAKYFPLSKEQYCELLEQSGFEIETSVDLSASGEFRDTQRPDAPIGFILKAKMRKAR